MVSEKAAIVALFLLSLMTYAPHAQAGYSHTVCVNGLAPGLTTPLWKEGQPVKYASGKLVTLADGQCYTLYGLREGAGHDNGGYWIQVQPWVPAYGQYAAFPSTITVHDWTPGPFTFTYQLYSTTFPAPPI